GATGLGMLPPQTSQQLSPVGVGDIRLLAKVRLMKEEEHGFSVALQPILTLPTGGALGGLGGVSVMPELLLSRKLGAVRLASNVGVDRKSTRLNSSHVKISYAVFCLKKKKK